MLRLVTTVLFNFRELGDLGLSTTPPQACCGISGDIIVRIRNDVEEAICLGASVLSPRCQPCQPHLCKAVVSIGQPGRVPVGLFRHFYPFVNARQYLTQVVLMRTLSLFTSEHSKVHKELTDVLNIYLPQSRCYHNNITFIK